MVCSYFRNWSKQKETLSETIFSESENPTRIFFALVNTEACTGNVHKNPLDFATRWSYTADAVEGSPVTSHEQNEQIMSDLLDKKTGKKFDILLRRLGVPPEQATEPPTRRSSVQIKNYQASLADHNHNKITKIQK
jgi:hypothetical protein